MGKISPVVAKYIVHIQIQIDGAVDKPDVIGAIFGQTEGLLGSDLELRELQRSGRVGRLEVNIETRSGKSSGYIIVPSSLDKAETAIIAAALETIQRIGPCDSRVKVEKIEDVRISKRNYVIERAKELLKNLTEAVLPDSQEITDEVAQSVRMMEIVEYGRERLPAGPDIDSSEEIILVEGRADVLNLLKHGIKNIVGLNGTSAPETIMELCKQKVVTLFVDGDRGGDIIIKGLVGIAEIDYVTKAPDGKEVEELTKKEIHKALRSRIAMEQIKPDIARVEVRQEQGIRRVELPKKEKLIFKEMLDKLLGTRGAYLLDKDLKILGKVPINEITRTIRSLSNIYAIVLDGVTDWELAKTAERGGVKYIVTAASKVNQENVRVEILTNRELV